MTRPVAITLRRQDLPERGEVRDCLETAWWPFLDACGLTALCLPNHVGQAGRLLERHEPAGVILSGGGEVARRPDARLERDHVEDLALAWASARGLPVLGVCRGLQKICLAAGGSLAPAAGHVATRHRVAGPGVDREVNSFHDDGIREAPGGFEVKARAEDGSSEWMQHARARVAGLMWHPERLPVPDPRDVLIFTSRFRI